MDLSDILILCGLILVAVGLYFISLPIMFITVGTVIFLLGLIGARNTPDKGGDGT